MYGRDVMFRRAHPYNLEMVELFRSECEFFITSRLLGIVAHTAAYPLYQHLRPWLGLPPWWQMAYVPQTIPGVRFVTGSYGYHAAVIPLDGAELDVYRLTPTTVGTLYTFDIDYRAGMWLLTGLPWRVLQDLSLWFAHDQPALGITIEEYLRAIAAASIL
jgi:hypothetical protein